MTTTAQVVTRTEPAAKSRILAGDNLWYKDAVIYELHVRAFADSDGDGIGDFKGLAEKLDYLQDLGVTAIWLLPFYPSPLKDDGYDIADYMDVHPSYGTLADFKYFLREAHERGLKVITELVLNHTSDQHAWFKRARKSAPGSRFRNYYVWNDNSEKYKETRIIFKDFEHSNWAWDPVAKAYYWHRFYSHQPDLNFESRDVQKAVIQVLDFWLGMGVDGLRLDAVPYLYEREGTNCENLPETHEMLKKLRKHVDTKFKGRMLLAEANQWPEEAVTYFGNGDECHMAFHFPIMPRLFMGIHQEDRYPIIDILQQTPAIPDTAQWAIFLRNHDELTLEMVTDEERDYMYRVYAHDPQARINLGIRRRLAPLLRNHRRKIELMNALLLSLPGTPVIYYGDEIGMGDNIYLGDRNGVRTPMQWSADRNAGFSRANPQRLYFPIIIDPEYHYETVNTEAQQNNPHSLLWWTKRLISLRKRFRAFSRGTIEFLNPENRKVLTFIRRYQDETILIIANLSRFVEYVELDLSAFKGMVPREVFSRAKFPAIGELPYFITLGPHGFYWFSIESKPSQEVSTGAREEKPPVLEAEKWEDVFEGTARESLEQILPNYLKSRRWFGGKAKNIVSVEISEVIFVPLEPEKAVILLLKVEYADNQPEGYLLPVTFAIGERLGQVLESHPQMVLCRLQIKDKDVRTEGVLYDASADKSFCRELLDGIERRRRFKGEKGEMVCVPTKALRELRGKKDVSLEPSTVKADQSNTSVIFGDRFVLKLFRRLDQGLNPDLEIGQFLTEKTAYSNIARVAGYLEYQRGRDLKVNLGILQSFVANQGDAWKYTLDEVERYFERVLSTQKDAKEIPLPEPHYYKLSQQEPSPLVRELISTYLESARLLGQRTAELHMALGSNQDDPNFSPEPFTSHYQRSLYQSMRNLTKQVFQLAGKNLKSFPETIRPQVQKVQSQEGKILKFFKTSMERKLSAMRIRCHGDFHLGQVLFTGKDFVIIDFEGEPNRALSERRLKRSPLWDVSSMLRSFDYASYAGLFRLQSRGAIQPELLPKMEIWSRFWHSWVCSAFLKAYLKGISQSNLLPVVKEEQESLLDAYVLEKAIYELGYELNNRPDWAKIPLNGIQRFLDMMRE
jgi:maltose alpha-D-glucosyltransferase / alpha-amylase